MVSLTPTQKLLKALEAGKEIRVTNTSTQVAYTPVTHPDGTPNVNHPKPWTDATGNRYASTELSAYDSPTTRGSAKQSAEWVTATEALYAHCVQFGMFKRIDSIAATTTEMDRMDRLFALAGLHPTFAEAMATRLKDDEYHLEKLRTEAWKVAETDAKAQGLSETEVKRLRNQAAVDATAHYNDEKNGH